MGGRSSPTRAHFMMQNESVKVLVVTQVPYEFLEVVTNLFPDWLDTILVFSLMNLSKYSTSSSILNVISNDRLDTCPQIPGNHNQSGLFVSFQQEDLKHPDLLAIFHRNSFIFPLKTNKPFPLALESHSSSQIFSTTYHPTIIKLFGNIVNHPFGGLLHDDFVFSSS